MPILDSYTLPLPDENKNAPGGSVLRRIAYGGFAMDGRVISNEGIKQIYYDTKNYIKKTGAMSKVTVVHPGWNRPENVQGEQLDGFIKRIELREEGDAKIITLWADMHLYPEVFDSFKQGRLPEFSIGALNGVLDSDGNQYENFLDHVAILGKTRAALPETKKSLFNSIISKLTEVFGFNNELKEVLNKMPISKIDELISPLENSLKLQQAILDGVRSLSALNGDDTPKDGEETPKEGEKEPTQTERKAISPTEITNQFNQLVSDGHIAPDARSDFDFLVEKTNDLQIATDFYSKKQVKSPPTGTETNSNRNEDTLDDLSLAIKRQAEKFNLSPEQMRIATGEEVK